MSTVAVNLLTLDTTHLLFDVIVHEKLRVQRQLRAKEVGKYEIAKKKANIQAEACKTGHLNILTVVGDRKTCVRLNWHSVQ